MTILDRTLPELKLELELAAYEAWSGRNMEGYVAMLPREKWADNLEAEIERREWSEKYPEHARLEAVPKEERDYIGDFIEWLWSQGYELGEWKDLFFTRTTMNPEEWLARYYGIDRRKLSAEKDEMYKDLVKEA